MSRDSHARLSREKMNRIRGFAAVAKRQLHRSARACCADTQSGRAPGPMLSKVEVWYPIRAPYGRPAPSLVAPSPAARCEGHPMRYTRFEKARIIGARALQISMGSPILIDVPSGVVDPIEIAWIEFNSGAIPITVKREM